ncbi:hypothetical protein WEI85_32450 [Actinomycetes bacterium KLBMP 9797]
MRRSALGAATAVLVLAGAGLTAPTAGAAPTASSPSAAGEDPRYWRRDGPAVPAEPRAAVPAPLRAAVPARPGTAVAGDATLTVSVRDRTGAAPATDRAGYALAFDLATGALTVVFLTDGSGSAAVTPGAYLVQAFVETVEASGDVSLSMPMGTGVLVAGDTETTVDARSTARVGISVDRAGAALAGGTVQVTVPTPGEQIWYAADFDYPGGLYVQPTGPVPGLALTVYGGLTQGGGTTSPYVYHLLFESANAIPRRPVYAARTSQLAALTVDLRGQGEPARGWFRPSGRHPDRPVGFGTSVTLGAVPARYGSVYVTPHPDVRWRLAAQVLPADCDESGGSDFFVLPDQAFPAVRRYPVPFGRAPLGPSLAGAAAPASREGNAMRIQIPMYADAGAGRDGGTATSFADYPFATGWTRLENAGGTLLGETDRTGFGRFEVPAEAGRYTLTTESTRKACWSALSIRQRTQWTFVSAYPKTTEALPLFAVRYDADLDTRNRAPAGESFTFGVALEPAVTLGRVPSYAKSDNKGPFLALSASFDDGGSWERVAVRRDGDRWLATVDHPAGAQHVSLRARATDAAGNTVDQTMIRAYALHP